MYINTMIMQNLGNDSLRAACFPGNSQNMIENVTDAMIAQFNIISGLYDAANMLADGLRLSETDSKKLFAKIDKLLVIEGIDINIIKTIYENYPQEIIKTCDGNGGRNSGHKRISLKESSVKVDTNGMKIAMISVSDGSTIEFPKSKWLVNQCPTCGKTATSQAKMIKCMFDHTNCTPIPPKGPDNTGGIEGGLIVQIKSLFDRNA